MKKTFTPFPNNTKQKKILDEFTAVVRDTTIGLLKLSVVDGVEFGEPVGTGTLVSAGSIFGVLTAAHVIGALPKESKVGVVRFRENKIHVQKQTIDMSEVEVICLGQQPFDAAGPDIGFLKLPQDSIGWLRATNIFHNLKKRQNSMLSTLDAAPYVDSLVGVVAERTQELSPVHADSSLLGVSAVFLSGETRNYRIAGGLDLIDFLPSWNEELEPPNSYGGVSGGGLWRLFLASDLNSKRGQSLLGVAFYQSDEIDYQRTITCHGPVTVYDKLIECIQERWPD